MIRIVAERILINMLLTMAIFVPPTILYLTGENVPSLWIYIGMYFCLNLILSSVIILAIMWEKRNTNRDQKYEN